MRPLTTTMRLKNKSLGIFSQVFLYTLLILVIVIGIMFLFFSNQIKATVATTLQLQMAEAFQPLLQQLMGKTTEEIIAIAEEFHEKNRFFNFRFEDETGKILFETADFVMPDSGNVLRDISPRRILVPLGPPQESLFQQDNIFEITGKRFNMPAGKLGNIIFLSRTGNSIHLYVSNTISDVSVYKSVLEKAAWISALVFLTSLAAAFLFARRIAKPIQQVSANTHQMSLLLPVDPPKKRGDEIGQLSQDVYAMYDKLKSTIGQLKTEIARVKHLEENQRYFFSAASHELKTPIAATGAILEGMLSEVIPPKEYPACLREGMKLIGEQNKLVSEILDLVKLNGTMPAQKTESVNLGQCVNSILAPLLPLIEAQEQKITVDIAETISCNLNTALFTKALSNILLNAAQNSPPGAEIRVAAQAGPTSQPASPKQTGSSRQTEPRTVILTVYNSGIQIPSVMLPKLFEPFFRTDEARTSGQGKSGLGLAIVKKALTLMNISCKLENIDDGVLFQMDIPQEVNYS